MDCLELCVRDRRLRNRRQCIVIRKRAEIVDEFGYGVGRRRYKDRGKRIIIAAADPILLRAKTSTVLGDSCRRKKAAMRFKQQLRSDGCASGDFRYRECHCVNIGEHLGRCDVRRLIALRACSIGAQQPAGADLQTLDVRGSDRFRAQ